jgi:WD40 repeat protein
MVVCVRWCPGNEHRFASCSYDGTTKLWDTRGKLPLHTVTAGNAGEGDRLFAVDFHGPTVSRAAAWTARCASTSWTTR